MLNERTASILERAREIELRTRRLVDEVMTGDNRSLFRGHGMDFEEVREYVPGDEVRAIDWNVTARAGRPFIKTFRAERELQVVLALDVSASGDFHFTERSERERLAEIACALTIAATRQQHRVGLVLFSDRVEAFVEPAKGREHALRVVATILGTELAGHGTDLRAALEHMDRIFRRRGIIVLLSDLLAPELLEAEGEPAPELAELDLALGRLAHRHDVVAVVPEGPLARELPKVGLLALRDLETGDVVRVDTSSRRVRERYAAAQSARLAQRDRLLRKHGIDALTLTPDQDPFRRLLGFFAGQHRSRR